MAREDYDDFVKQAEADSATWLAQAESSDAAEDARIQGNLARAAQARDAAQARALGLANRSDEFYNPDRPSSWAASDSPMLMERSRKLGKDYNDSPSRQAEFQAQTAAFDVEDDAAVVQGLQRGPGSMDIAGAVNMRGGQMDADANQIRDLLLAGRNAPSSPNPLHPIRQQYAQDMLGTGGTITDLDPSGNVVERGDGLIDEEQWRTQWLQAAQVDEQRAHAEAYGQESARQQARIDVMEQKAMRDAQRQQDAIKASQLVMSKVSEAADRLNASPDIDPNRYWANQSSGRKAMWAISAGLLGFAGLNPFGALQTAISNDIDAQKASFAQKQAGFAARQGELDSSRSVYQDIRTAIGDEQATDLMMEQARLMQAETAFKAMAVKEGIPPAIAANNLFLTQMQQRNAEITKTLGEMMATTPRRIGGGWQPLVTGPNRKLLEGELKDLRKRGGELAIKGIDIGADAALEDRKIEGEIRKERAKGPTPEGQKLEYTQRHNLTKDIEPFVNEARLIEKFQNEYPNEIPGIAWGVKPTTITDDQKLAYARLKRIVMVRLRRESGAAISDPELERDAEEVLQAMDEDDVRNMLADRLEEAKSRIDYFSRAPNEAEVEQVNRAKVAPRAPLADGGVGLPDVVSWDDD